MNSKPVTDNQPNEQQSEINQPGLRRLREAVENQRKQLRGGRLRRNGIAGLSTALSQIPDGLAAGLLAGVNPIYGLYANMVGPLAGGIFSSTQRMVITTTSAASLAAGQALIGVPNEARDNALFLMVLVIGIFQIVFGLLRLGRLTRFVSYSVMTGFIIGIAVLTILSQLSTVTGYEPTGGNRVTQALSLIANLGQINLQALAIATLTLILAIVLPRTRLGNLGTLVAIALPSVLVLILGMRSVQVVQDVGSIPNGLPPLFVPSLSDLTPDVLTGALAVALIILVQGAGVSQSVPNPDGSRKSMSRDFMAQGAANLASGFFRGLPVGGSLSATALSVSAGSRSRWTVILTGFWIAVAVLVFPGLVSYVAMPALGALLIVASASTIKPMDVLSIWSTGWESWLASGTTFLATLFLPIQVAVGIGVVLSAVVHLYESASEVTLVAFVERTDGRIEPRRPPKHLPSRPATILDVSGHLFYAGARTLERLLPRPEEGARDPVVILRLRGSHTVGATLVDVLTDYSDDLLSVNGRLYLTGLSKGAYNQVIESTKLHSNGQVRAYEATPIHRQSTRRALADAEAWLAESTNEASPDDSSSDDGSR
jgi:SulP family sulfate permease